MKTNYHYGESSGVERMGTGRAIRPLHTGNEKNGDIKIYKMIKGKLEYIETLEARVSHYDTDGNRIKDVEPNKMRTQLRSRSKPLVAFKCVDCDIPGIRRQPTMLRCRPCQEVRAKKLRTLSGQDRCRRGLTAKKNKKYGRRPNNG